MNKKITIPLAGLAIAVALAGCNSKSGSVSAVQASQRAHALATSSNGQEAQQVGRDLAGTCLPAKDLNRAYFINLALHKDAAVALAGKCEIPRENIKPFAQAVFSSVSQAYLSGNHFDTPAKRDAWAQKDFPVIVKKYQGKK